VATNSQENTHMKIFTTASELTKFLSEQHQHGKTVGFVPTMGALHAGHLSLIKKAQSISQLTICSIFVNPTQFNNPDDFAKYPISIEEDQLLLDKAGADVLFLPSVKEIYPEGTTALHHYDFGYLETILEGAYRPGHFQGVGQVMHRFLELIHPDFLFMGQKDYQQCLIVKRLLEMTGIKTKFIMCPIIREPNGLAMSSRNRRLNTEDYNKATSIHSSLEFIKNNLTSDSLSSLQQTAMEILKSDGFEADYVAITDDHLKVLPSPIPGKMLGLVAASIHGIRLIDNTFLNEK
jgi:pantoate--beta-alanine ligase